MTASIYNVESNNEYDGSVIERNNHSYLKKFLTKQMCKILLFLFYQTLSNKELAKQMGITTNALSNILQRMKASQVDLFIISKKEKFTLYSLTPIAQEYVRKYLIAEEDLDRKVIQFSNDVSSNYMECIDALQKMKDSLQIDSITEFRQFIELYYIKKNKEKRAIIDDFMRHFVKVGNGKQTDDFHKIIEELGDSLLGRNILHYLNIYKSMATLCKIYDMSWKTSYKFVNSVFDLEGTGVGIDVLGECDGLESKEIYEMAKGLWEIVDISGKNNQSMEEFIECWLACFPEEELLHFLASRYDSWIAKHQNCAR